MVDDHAIDSLKTWYDISYEELKKEWTSGQYSIFSECPNFKTCNTYREALNVLINGTKHSNEKQLKNMIEEELETENFWKNRI